MNFPSFESHFPDMMKFISSLTQGYRSGEINSPEVLEKRIHTFFTAEKLAEVKAMVPPWFHIANDSDGNTLAHIMAAFISLLLCPEFLKASKKQQELLKWIVFFHDIDKRIRKGQRDFTHGFRSAAVTGKMLPRLGFDVAPEYDGLIKDWIKSVNSAKTRQQGKTYNVQDNRRLPEIFSGIERLFGHNTHSALIVETVLLHMSIDVVKDWPQTAPLTGSEMKKYIDIELCPLLKVMMLVDNDAWALFDQPTKEQYRRETLSVFKKIESVFAAD